MKRGWKNREWDNSSRKAAQPLRGVSSASDNDEDELLPLTLPPPPNTARSVELERRWLWQRRKDTIAKQWKRPMAKRTQPATGATLMGRQTPRQTKDRLNLHKGLPKAESPLLVQTRTRKRDYEPSFSNEESQILPHLCAFAEKRSGV